MMELSNPEKDLVILGMIAAGARIGPQTNCSKRAKQNNRKHQRTLYSFDGQAVCRETLKFLCIISQDKLSAIFKHYKENGICPRKLKSGGRSNNKKALSFDDTKTVVTFIVNFAEEHALLLPGREIL